MIKIISDSTCDLSKELIEKYDITILPLHIHLDEEEYQDGVTITPDEIYTWADANNTTPKTSAASMVEATELFEPYIKNGDEIIAFSISSTMSANNNVMRLAAEDLEAEDTIHVIDSANLSTGIGLLVIEAAIMAKEGHTADEIVARIEELKPLVSASFVVDTLTYLHRGGRCSSVAALAGGALKLHPKIVVEDGKMAANKKYRGKMNSVILSYAKDLEEDLKMAKKDRVFITHSGCEDSIINEMRNYLESLEKFDEILVTRAGGVISSHCGPGTLGILFIKGE
ncbi:MAG: DegV family protein [Tyzzerella sp.]|nr:DegV family protein [Tyzzerella sp.]